MTTPENDTITILVPFSKQEVQVPRAVWRDCQRLENRLAIACLAVLAVVFAFGAEKEGVIQIAGLGFIIVGWFYFDGTVARKCAARRVMRMLKSDAPRD